MPRCNTMDPSLIETQHIWTRCVRRAFLMGRDPVTGHDYSHRRTWLFSLHEYLASVLMVDVGAPNILSNHFHDTMRSRPDLVEPMTNEEVVWRYSMAWPSWDHKRKVWFCQPTDANLKLKLRRGAEDEDYFPRLRRDLSNISFYMGRLKETISKMANREEKPKQAGPYWAGAFGNRRLDTPTEVVGSVLYCDLQQIKARMVDRLEDSNYSGIQAQIRARAHQAFEDVSQRAADAERDGEALEQLEAMVANAWLSPISNSSRLITEPQDEPRARELVLPSGYTFDIAAQKHSSPSDSEDESNHDSKVAAEKDVDDDADSDTGSTNEPPRRKRGRPRVHRPRTIHKRLVRKQRRRASNNSILGLSWEEYYPVVQAIAEQFTKDRDELFPALEPDPQSQVGVPISAAPHSTSSTARKEFTKFCNWLQANASEAFGKLLNLRAARPRAPS